MKLDQLLIEYSEFLERGPNLEDPYEGAKIVEQIEFHILSELKQELTDKEKVDLLIQLSISQLLTPPTRPRLQRG